MCRNTIFTYKRYIADHDEIDFKKGQIMKKNYSGNNSRSYKNRILKTSGHIGCFPLRNPKKYGMSVICRLRKWNEKWQKV